MSEQRAGAAGVWECVLAWFLLTMALELLLESGAGCACERGVLSVSTRMCW